MPSIHGDQFGCDLYEGKNVLFLYDGRKCPQKSESQLWFVVGIVLFFGCIVLSVMITEAIMGNFPCPWLLLPIFIICFAAFLFFLCTPNLQLFFKRQALRIDARQIRYDWWYFCFRGTHIFERDREITLEIVESELGREKNKLRLTFGKKKLTVSLATVAETDWVCERIRQFLERVPPERTTDAATKVRTIKGKFSDHDSGTTILKTLVSNGEPLTRIMPDIELKRDQPPPTSGPILVRCCKCHAYVPADQVWPDHAMAQCLECESVFVIPELVRLFPKKQRRVTIERDGETITLRQVGNFGFIPMSTFLCSVFGLVVIGGLIAYVHYLNPNITWAEMFPPTHNNSPDGPSDAARAVVISMTIGIVVCILLLPFWAFFDRRVIRIDRRECRVAFRWLFLHWERTIPRRNVLFADTTEWGIDRLFRLHYRDAHSKQRTFRIGGPGDTTTSHRIATTVDWVVGEINHYLMTVPPEHDERFEHFESTSQMPVVFGGVHLAGDVTHLLCPSCGNTLESAVVRLSQKTSVCPHCTQSFTTKSLISTKGKNVEIPLIDGLECRETSEEFEIHYKPAVSKAARWAFWLLLFFSLIFMYGFLGVMPLLLFMQKCHEGKAIETIVLLAIPYSMLAFFTLMTLIGFRELRDWEWRLHLRADEFELWYRYKARERRIVIPLHEIVAVDGCDNGTQVFISIKSLLREWRTGELSIPTCGTTFLQIRDGTRQYLSGVHTSGGTSNGQTRSRYFNAWFIATLELHLAKRKAHRVNASHKTTSI